jgi:FkbM family methyltransferase
MFIRKFKNYIRDKVWVFLKTKWVLKSGIFIKVENDSDWYVFNEIFTNKEYDSAIKLFLPSASLNPLILDLGANVGYFTLRVADELALAGFSNYTIIALEGTPSNYKVLQQRLEQPLLKNKAKGFLGLAGHKTGTSKVIHSPQHYGHSSVAGTAGSKTTDVSYVNIEELIADETKIIDLLKCDIEGSEEIFITAYANLLSRVDTAVFEFHAGECDIQNCRQMLQAAGLFSKGIIKEETYYKTTVEVFSRK